MRDGPRDSGGSVFVESGRRGALKRWGPPRTIKLDGLAPEQRAFIVELVDVAKRNAKAVTEGQSPVTAELDGTGNARPAA